MALTAGNVVRLDSEDIQIESISGSSVQVVRGWRGTTPVAHLAGADIFITGSPLTINGADTIYRDLEIPHSGINRTEERSFKLRGTGGNIYGTRVKLVNSVIQDTAQGIGFWVQAVDAEIYGNIIFNNGYCDADKSIGSDNWINGHGICTQIDQGTKRISHNVIFSQFGFGIHAYYNELSVKQLPDYKECPF